MSAKSSSIKEITARDLSPSGVPRGLILLLTLGTSAISTQWVCNPAPFIDLLLANKCLSWQYTPEEAKEILMATCNFSYSVCLVSFAFMGAISSLIPLRLWCAGVIFNFAFCIWGTMFTQSTFLVKLGILLGMHLLPCVAIFAFSINEMFPASLDLVNAMVSSAGDVSFCTTLLVRKLADYFGVSYKSATLFTFCVFLCFSVPCCLLTPRTWEPYSLSRKAITNMIDMETYQQYKQNITVPSVRSMFKKEKQENKDIEKKVNFIYDPYTMPLYHSYTHFYQVIMSKHMMLFLGWFLLHYVRDKKLLLPYISDVIKEKAMKLGKSPAEANTMYDFWNFTPALGSIPGISFGVLASRWGQAQAWNVANLICVIMFIIIYMGNWESMWLGGIIFSLHNSLVFSLITAFAGQNYGFRHVQMCMGFAFCICGTLGFAIDATWDNLVKTSFNGSYLDSQLITVLVSLLSMIPMILLYIIPMPGPPMAEQYLCKVESDMGSLHTVALSELTLVNDGNSDDTDFNPLRKVEKHQV